MNFDGNGKKERKKKATFAVRGGSCDSILLLRGKEKKSEALVFSFRIATVCKLAVRNFQS